MISKKVSMYLSPVRGAQWWTKSGRQPEPQNIQSGVLGLVCIKVKLVITKTSNICVLKLGHIY